MIVDDVEDRTAEPAIHVVENWYEEFRDREQPKSRKTNYIAPTLGLLIAVGMPVTRHPPHRSRRALLMHRAPTSDG